MQEWRFGSVRLVIRIYLLAVDATQPFREHVQVGVINVAIWEDVFFDNTLGPYV